MCMYISIGGVVSFSRFRSGPHAHTRMHRTVHAHAPLTHSAVREKRLVIPVLHERGDNLQSPNGSFKILNYN